MSFEAVAFCLILPLVLIGVVAALWLDRRRERLVENALDATLEAGQVAQRLGLTLLVGAPGYNLASGHKNIAMPARAKGVRTRVYMAGRSYQRATDLRYQCDRSESTGVTLTLQLSVDVGAEFTAFTVLGRQSLRDAHLSLRDAHLPRQPLPDPSLDRVLSLFTPDKALASRLAPAFAPLLRFQGDFLLSAAHGTVRFVASPMHWIEHLHQLDLALFTLASVACALERRSLPQRLVAEARVDAAPCASCGGIVPTGAPSGRCERCTKSARQPMSTLELDMSLGWQQQVQDAVAPRPRAPTTTPTASPGFIIATSLIACTLPPMLSYVFDVAASNEEGLRAWLPYVVGALLPVAGAVLPLAWSVVQTLKQHRSEAARLRSAAWCQGCGRERNEFDSAVTCAYCGTKGEPSSEQDRLQVRLESAPVGVIGLLRAQRRALPWIFAGVWLGSMFGYGAQAALRILLR